MLNEANTEPRLPDTAWPSATLLLLLVLERNVRQTDLTDDPDSFQDAQQSLRKLGWELERDVSGASIRLADVDPPVPGYDDYEHYVHARCFGDVGFVRRTLREEAFVRLRNYIQLVDRKEPATVPPMLRPGESTAHPFYDDKESTGRESAPVAVALG